MLAKAITLGITTGCGGTLWGETATGHDPALFPIR
jgi:hypothetical protein